ncbi:MAG: hypothetical protein OQL11_07720 [Gammaproteobacteria bacterium]|nr:hypothetical protein [Gammaproteobacteria bacterium]
MEINNIKPSADLYLEVRAGFIRKGTTFTAWCRAQGWNPTNVKAALMGAWNGPEGRKVRSQAVHDAGVSKVSLCA